MDSPAVPPSPADTARPRPPEELRTWDPERVAPVGTPVPPQDRLPCQPTADDTAREEVTVEPPVGRWVFLDHLDASIDQADQVAAAAMAISVHASLVAIARLARHADSAAETVTFDECDTPGCAHLVVTGTFTDDGEAEYAISEYARNLRRDNGTIWEPYIDANPDGRFVLDIAKTLALPQPNSQIGYTRGEVKYGAGQTPGRDGQPSPTRYFPVDLATREESAP